MSCTSCGCSIHEKKTNLPTVYVFGKQPCRYADMAEGLIEGEKKRPDSCIDIRSVYTVMHSNTLRNMQPVFKTSPRVYIDYSNAPMEDVEFDNKNFLGGYTELLAFLNKQRIHAVDSVIQDFVATHDTTMFLVVAADWCGYCEQLMEDLTWDYKQGHASYRSKDATALCITTGRNPLVSDVLRADGIVIKGYPTVLEYSSKEQKWLKTDQSVLRRRSWSHEE
jgi:thiol-disulfide isomerase/thioredoxin